MTKEINELSVGKLKESIVKNILNQNFVGAKSLIENKLQENAFVVLREHKKIVAAKLSENAYTPTWAGNPTDDGNYPEGPKTFDKNAVKEPSGPPNKKYWGKQKTFTPNKKPVENPKHPAPRVLIKKKTGKLAGMEG